MRASLLAAGLGLLALSACATDDNNPSTRSSAVTPTEQYSIDVAPAPVELALAAHASGLSQAQTAALTDLVGRWGAANRSGPITIKAPEHGPDDSAVYRTVTDARDYLVAQGVDAQLVRIVGYDAGGDPKAPVRVGFIHYEAHGPQCGQSWSNVADVRSNRPYPEFGCSVTANVAAQLANPEDLLHPREMTPPDAVRRETVLGHYRSGDTTSTAKDTQANGAVSQTVGN